MVPRGRAKQRVGSTGPTHMETTWGAPVGEAVAKSVGSTLSVLRKKLKSTGEEKIAWIESKDLYENQVNHDTNTILE